VAIIQVRCRKPPSDARQNGRGRDACPNLPPERMVNNSNWSGWLLGQHPLPSSLVWQSSGQVSFYPRPFSTVMGETILSEAAFKRGTIDFSLHRLVGHALDVHLGHDCYLSTFWTNPPDGYAELHRLYEYSHKTGQDIRRGSPCWPYGPHRRPNLSAVGTVAQIDTCRGMHVHRRLMVLPMR